MVDLSAKNVKKNMLLGTVLKGLSMLISYLYVPLMLFYLGEVKYGVWTTILNVLSWINYFDIGIGNGLRNKLTECLAGENDSKTIKKYVSSAYVMLGSIILVVMFVACLFAFGANWNSIFGVKEIDENLMLIMQISIIFVAVNFWLSLCKSILYALQKNSYVSMMDVAQQIIMLINVIILTQTKTRSILLVSVLYGFSNFIVSGICNLRLFIRNRDFIPRLSCFARKEAKETTGLGLLFFVVQISALVLFTTDSLLISHYIGPAEVTSYSIANKLFSMGTAVFAVLVAPYWSRTAGASAKGDYKTIKDSIKNMYVFLVAGIVAVIVLVFIFEPLSDMWLRQKLEYPTGLIPLMAVYAIIYMWNAIYSQIANGLSLMNVVVPVAVIQGVMNIPLSLVFLSRCNLGVVGVLLGTVMSTMVAAIFVPIFVHREINHRINDRC